MKFSELKNAGFRKYVSSEDEGFVKSVGKKNLYLLEEVLTPSLVKYLKIKDTPRVIPSFGAKFRSNFIRPGNYHYSIPDRVITTGKKVFQKGMDPTHPLLVSAVYSVDPDFVYVLGDEVNDSFATMMAEHGQTATLEQPRVDVALMRILRSGQSGKGVDDGDTIYYDDDFIGETFFYGV